MTNLPLEPELSFEAGMTQLGGHSLFLSNSDTQLGRGEPISDSSKVISSMVDCIMLRISKHSDIVEFAKNSTIPVINALSDESHPCQLLADIMTFKELIGDIKGKNICYIGDGNNMANTYAQAAKIFDFKLNISSPKGYTLADKFINKNVELFDNPMEACKNADAIITDVWASMGQEKETQARELAFKKFQVNTEMMSLANKNVIFMHCLPAHRGEEVSAEVIDGNSSVVFLEAENRFTRTKIFIIIFNAITLYGAKNI